MPPDRSRPLARASGALSAFAQKSGVSSFLRWWGAELAPLVPSSARNAVARRRMRPILAFDGAVATAWQPRMRDGAVSVEPVATVALDADPQAVAAAGRQAVEGLARGAGGSGTPRVRLAVPSRSVLRRRLTLPAALEENLRQAIGYDLDRLTPFKADELYYDAVVVARDAAKGTIDVDFAAVRRPIVDTALAWATGWGAEVRSVTPDAPGAPVTRLDLAPEEARVSPAPWKRWQFWAPAAALAVVALVAVVLPLWQKRDYAIAVIQRAELARQQAAVSERLRTELEAAASDYNFALERKYAWPPIVRVLDTMTSVLPDDTWITQLEIRTLPKGRERDRELVIRGESGNAGKLIPILEESGLVAQVAPRSPVTKIQPGPGEIFDLGAQLKPLAKPVMLSLLADADAPRPPKPAVAAAPPPPPAPAPVRAPAQDAAAQDADAAAQAQDDPPAQAQAAEPPPQQDARPGSQRRQEARRDRWSGNAQRRQQ